MAAAPGAADAVKHCGGLRAVLTAVDFDFTLVWQPEDCRVSSTLLDTMPLKHLKSWKQTASCVQT